MNGANVVSNPAPLYVVRDNVAGRVISSPHERAGAGRIATQHTLAAGRRGDVVATARGLDRFTVERVQA